MTKQSKESFELTKNIHSRELTYGNGANKDALEALEGLYREACRGTVDNSQLRKNLYEILKAALRDE